MRRECHHFTSISFAPAGIRVCTQKPSETAYLWPCVPDDCHLIFIIHKAPFNSSRVTFPPPRQFTFLPDNGKGNRPLLVCAPAMPHKAWFSCPAQNPPHKAMQTKSGAPADVAVGIRPRIVQVGIEHASVTAIVPVATANQTPPKRPVP